MTYQTDCTLPASLLEEIAEQGLEVLPDPIRTVINAAMDIERQQFLAGVIVIAIEKGKIDCNCECDWELELEWDWGMSPIRFEVERALY